MRKLVVVVVAAVLVAALVPGVVRAAPSAKAVQYWNIYDGPRDARAGIDAKITYLSTRTAGSYVVTVKGYEFLRGRLNVVAVNLDTRRRDAGPEFRLQWLLPRDGDGHARLRLARIDTWDRTGRTVRCARLGRSVDYRRDVVRLAVPRSCVGRPPSVRWNVYTGRVTRYLAHGHVRGYFDDVPAKNRFIAGLWVA